MGAEVEQTAQQCERYIQYVQESLFVIVVWKAVHMHAHVSYTAEYICAGAVSVALSLGMFRSHKLFIPTGRGNDALLVSNVSTSQNDAVNNPVYAVTNPMAVDGAIYEDLHPEGVTVHTPAVTAFTGDERYSKLQRESSLLTQSVASTITGDENVEAYYGRLGSSEQYAVSAWYMCCDVVSCSLHACNQGPLEDLNRILHTVWSILVFLC